MLVEEPMTGGPSVAEIMTQLVMTTTPDASLEEAARLLRECHVSGLPVVDAEDRVVGVVSEKDIVRMLHKAAGVGHARGLLDVLLESAPAKGESVLTVCRRRLRNTRVREVMSRPVVAVEPQTSLIEAAQLMKRKGVNRLPVLDARQRLVGIVTRCDIVGDLSATAPRAGGSLHPAPREVRPGVRRSDPYGDI
jgi:CBS domain-containing protein